MDAILPSMPRRTRRADWNELIDKDFDSGKCSVKACGLADSVFDTLMLFGPNIEEGNRVPDKTAVEVHTIEGQVAFILRGLGPDRGVGQKAGLELSASASIPHEDFPGLRSAILLSSWPVVVNNEQCRMPANVGEDDAGPSCTGKTVSVISQALTATGLGEDYHGFVGAPPTGSRVTIDFSLVMVQAASSFSERSEIRRRWTSVKRVAEPVAKLPWPDDY